MEFRDLERVAVRPVSRIKLNPVDLAEVRVELAGRSDMRPMRPWGTITGTQPGVAAVVHGVPIYQDSAVQVGTIETEGA